MEKSYKKIYYHELFEVINSSTPADTLDTWNSLEKFIKEKDAEILKQEKERELFIKIKENPIYPNTHTKYNIKNQCLRLRK